MTRSSHLTLGEIIVQPGAEWPNQTGWRLARLAEGHGYWVDRGDIRELEKGQLLVIPPRSQGALRASQLSPIRLQYFDWRPELLTGILTLPERHFFAAAGAASIPLRTLRADGEIARHFEELAADHAERPALAGRCRMLQLIAETFSAEINRAAPPAAPGGACAADRFQELLAGFTDSEILDYSPAQLARRCGCSARHFARLFYQRFGVSVRQRQTHLRLLKAQELLASNDHKIIDVALDSGYRNLGLFNKLFKKHLGATPSEWRRRHAPPAPARRRFAPVAMLCLIAGWLLLTGAASAAPAATNAAPAFRVGGYDVEGNTVLPHDLIDKTLAPFTGEHVTLENIRKGLTELQLAYRARGFVTVKVGLPQQQLTNGVVRVTVTEGRLAEITISKNRYFSSNNVMRALPGLHTNMLLNSLVFQQTLDQANANRDRQIYPEIAPGPEPGTTALRLKVVDRLPWHARFDVDNESTPGTPDIRLGASSQYNNLWDLDHQLGVQYMFSPAVEKETGHKISWPIDDPRFVSYSGFYRMPIFLGHAESTNAAPPLSGFGYDEVTHKFKAPPAFGNPELIMYASRSVVDTGIGVVSSSSTPLGPGGTGLQVNQTLYSESLTFTEDLGFRFTHPAPSFWGINSSLSLGVDYKAFHQIGIQTKSVVALSIFTNATGHVTNALQSPPFAAQYVPTSVNYLPFAFNWDANRLDSWGVSSFYVDQTFNLNALSSSSRRQFATVAETSTAKSDGNFYIISAGVTRELKMPRDFGLTLRAAGQWASQTLIGNEQFALGGEVGPRGYRDGEEYGDAGWRFSLEPHTPYYHVTMINDTIPVMLQGSVFTDYGRRYFFSPKLLDPNGVPLSGADARAAEADLWGAGLGLNGTIGQTFDFHFTFGFPLISAGTTKAGDPRVEFALSAQF
ncbi:MAG TPA: helix-turn-helix domain-containing protein [Verrucomicrobiae bacterium]|jgi:hemolysin activation/secretion protein/AraC-like DNA-binding protein|nr:helix-turn-helix domain-containing protein [Verrucomicrobiae bacterium]